MSSLAQKSQFINEPGQYFVHGLANPPAAAVASLEHSIAEAQDKGAGVDPDAGLKILYRHADDFKDTNDAVSMSNQQFAS